MATHAAVVSADTDENGNSKTMAGLRATQESVSAKTGELDGHYGISETAAKYDQQYSVSETATVAAAKTSAALSWGAAVAHGWWTGNPAVAEEAAPAEDAPAAEEEAPAAQ